MTLRLATYNIQYGFGRDGRLSLARAIASVATADILALQEVERNWRRSGMSDQPAEIAALLPDHFHVYGAPFDVDAGGGAAGRRRQFGLMVLSRWPILSTRLHILPKHDTRASFNITTGMVEAVIDAPGGALRIYDVHLGDVAAAERLDQIARLRQVLRSAPEEGGAWSGGGAGDAHWQTEERPPPMPASAILLGDFNATPGTAEYQALLEPIAPGTRRGVSADRLVDAWLAAGNAEAEGVTFRADPAQGAFHDMRIDFCFVTADLAPRIRRCWCDAVADGSDHQPVWTEIEW